MCMRCLSEPKACALKHGPNDLFENLQCTALFVNGRNTYINRAYQRDNYCTSWAIMMHEHSQVSDICNIKPRERFFFICKLQKDQIFAV